MTTIQAGDPAALRQAAAQLNHRAAVFAEIAGQVDATVAGMVYVGPAADAFRANMTAASNKMRAACAGINDLSTRMMREADRIENDRMVNVWLR